MPNIMFWLTHGLSTLCTGFIMLFTSLMFIGIFLPITFAVYFGLNRARLAQAGKVWLVAASLFFYSYWNIAYLPLILGSMVVNFGIGSGLGQRSRRVIPPEINGYQK